MKTILAIGGAVIKTAREQLRQVIEKGEVEILIHNGGSIFHDFQISMEGWTDKTSYPLDTLVDNFKCNKPASDRLWEWFSETNTAPSNSITNLCDSLFIPVMVFTGLGCDFWQLFGNDWKIFTKKTHFNFNYLCNRFRKPFHYLCMGSAVIHPEVFTKALAVSKQKNFKADVVDFLNMYRPLSRVAKNGVYYKMNHKDFLTNWNKDGIVKIF